MGCEVGPIDGHMGDAPPKDASNQCPKSSVHNDSGVGTSPPALDIGRHKAKEDAQGYQGCIGRYGKSAQLK